MKLSTIALAAASLMMPLLDGAHAAPLTKTAVSAPSSAGAQQWDLTRLYADDAAWEAERQAIMAEFPKLKAMQGTLGQSAQSLQAGLDLMSAMQRRLARLQSYSSMKADEDTQLTAHQARSQLGDQIYNQYGEAISF
ncbi:hypothetical protein, partial [Roseateles sp.]|uniref:hypothetical protein n=1 Tax=Roseateles sp. TaxID=1971397 RepID=UPI00286BCE29